MPILCLDKYSIKIPPTQSVKYPPNKLLSNIVFWIQLHCKHFTKCGLIAIPKRSRNGESCIHLCRAVLDVNIAFTNAVPAYLIKMEDITITHFGWWKCLICLCSFFFGNIIITAPHSSQSSVKCLYNDTRRQPQLSSATPFISPDHFAAINISVQTKRDGMDTPFAMQIEDPAPLTT